MAALLERPVAALQATDVLAVVMPIWLEKHTTADRVLRRISTVLKWAVAEGLRRDDPCPAVRAALPRKKSVAKHHRSIPHMELGRALERINDCDASTGTKLVVRLLALTAVRTAEVRLANWDEVDLETDTWVIAGSRTKTAREHRVPLSRQAIEVLEKARPLSGGRSLVFPGRIC